MDGYMNKAGFACTRAEAEAEAYSARVKRLQDAIEGECDGLAITADHARAILQYVDGTALSPGGDGGAKTLVDPAVPMLGEEK